MSWHRSDRAGQLEWRPRSHLDVRPRISLMAELIGLAYYPRRRCDRRRATGRSRRDATARSRAHPHLRLRIARDTKHILLFPATRPSASTSRCAASTSQDHFQTPVMMLSDVDMRMNDWCAATIVGRHAVPDRGASSARKSSSADREYHRTAIRRRPVRHAPCPRQHKARTSHADRPHGAGRYTETPDEYQKGSTGSPASRSCGGACAATVIERRELAPPWSRWVAATPACASHRAARAMGCDSLHGGSAASRCAGLQDFLDDHDTVFVVEQNRDAQLRSLWCWTRVPKDRLRSVLAYGGFRSAPARSSTASALSWRLTMHPSQAVDRAPGIAAQRPGLTVRDYEGSMSTLCAGCGHDSVTAAIVRALWEMEAPPHMIAKLSASVVGRRDAYFARVPRFHTAHGDGDDRHRRRGGNRDLLYIGISGDGDSLSIAGHLAHLIRRNVRMVYIIENNGCTA